MAEYQLPGAIGRKQCMIPIDSGTNRTTFGYDVLSKDPDPLSVSFQ